MTTKIRIERPALVAALIERDGTLCQYPGEEHELDFSIKEGSREVTIDHHMPQTFGRANGWTEDEIWDLSNLRLMCKKHNARKADRIPNEDGTLPERQQSTFRYRRDKRATRPELCLACDNGHNLLIGEFCASCGCDARRFPRWAKVKFQDCSHDITWCWACSIGIAERESSIETAIRQAESNEFGEMGP